MPTDFKDRIELEKLEVRKLEIKAQLEQLRIEREKGPGKILGLRSDEWTDLGYTAGGCIWSLPVIALFVAIILDPSRIEQYDQFIVSFGSAAFAFYLARNIYKK